MYTGHLAVGLAARRWAPRAPVLALVSAGALLDLVDALLELAGVPNPGTRLTHTPPAALAWSLALALAAWPLAGRRAAIALGLVAFLHLPADYLTSRLELWPRGPEFGLHLYAYRGVDWALETALVAAAWALYRETLPAPARAGAPAWGVLAVLVACQTVFALLPIG